ncbi:MAG: glutamine--tRNA ligase/YqeY domain fusion protein [Gammaproteobacteria bacterium]
MTEPSKDFIRQIIASDVATRKHGGRVATRFPPEPNGYLHIGHAKSICLNFGVALENDAQCILRMDDTNPLKEDQSFVDAITEDVRWLGFDWGERMTHASDYFQQFHDCAVRLIEAGDAYVDSQSGEEIREQRGTLTVPGKAGPYRDRPVAENLDLFQCMRAGKFADGTHVLRAKIDMSAPNINMRDPVLYRIRKAPHQRSGDDWCIYPMYDFAHSISDALEGITHSLCTLEFEDHRPLYNWILERLDFEDPPQQIEFSRLNLAYTITSKRKLAELIELGHVDGWDDPRMPTLAGMRRRGFTPAAIRDFCERVGITKKENIIQMGVLENSVRQDLDGKAPRRMAILDPLKLVITNFPEGKTELHQAANHPNDPDMGTRELPFGQELFIERGDFMEDPPRKFFRLKPGGEVRLRYGYIIKCVDVIKDAQGVVQEVHCTYDNDTSSGSSGAQRKVKGTIHWLDAAHAVPAEVRLYDRLFSVARPDMQEGKDFKDFLNPDAFAVIEHAYVEPILAEAAAGDFVQFERTGYFVRERENGGNNRPVFNRIITLRDSWAKIEKVDALS